MKLTDILGMIGGLSLFFYGMNMMSEGMKESAGTHLEYVLQYLTGQKYKAILVGIIVTALIHSSSAMTVMLVGFVDAGIMPLIQAVWVVMGANIGTTVTSQMIALQLGMIAPIFAFIGSCLRYSQKYFHIGNIFGGIGLLFMGLEFMSISLAPLQNTPFFQTLLTYVTHPLLGILIGAFLTSLIQSSSASMGVLISLSQSQSITLSQATYLIFGFEIGTCVTAFLASLSTNQTSQKLALFHILLNIFGVFVFTILTYVTPLISWIEMLTPSLAHQLAHMQTIFNIGTTLFALCLDQFLLKIIDTVYSITPLKSTCNYQ